jgi:Spy/CpxP family protein refolding chaperone
MLPRLRYMSRSKKTKRIRLRSTLLSFSMGISCSAAFADDHCNIDWTKLNLTPVQQQQISALESDWNKQYAEIRPGILEEQRHLSKLLGDHTADPVEIMSVQQNLTRKKESLNQLATANYLKKRSVLTESQQFSLEIMVKNAVSMRQRMNNPGGQTEVMPDRVQSLIERVRNIWPTAGP